ncbi:TauD/TfdA family dioxygenase [Streptomyces xinghaiensis]|uniref:TauD/TfdA family dioxygenase n=1 Tax=Streptomyces xinghaiensis TaxID=1038928 RepID=UPI00342F4E23
METETTAYPAVLGECSGRSEGTAHTRVIVYEPGPAGLRTTRWAAEHRSHLIDALDRCGAVLVRRAVDRAETLDRVAACLGGEPLDYTERSTPRSRVGGHVYTSTEYPAAQTIAQHNENAYARSYPHWLFFAALETATTGGETPLADSRALVRHLPRELVDRFRDKGVRYSRTYREGMGLTWQEAFQTRDPREVERYCGAHGIDVEWTADGLRTRQHGPALVADPRSGEESWFNQAHLFHSSNLPPDVRESLAELYAEEDMPRAAHYGDGTTIPDEEMDLVRAAYDACSFVFPWERGDLLLVNNLLVSHGRRPYTGSRRTLVAMAEKISTRRTGPGTYFFDL